MKYRSRPEIVSSILEAANGGTTRTKIMYRAFLSYAQLKEYLSMLIAKGLIDNDPVTQLYRTNAKGHGYLKLAEEMVSLYNVPVGIKVALSPEAQRIKARS